MSKRCAISLELYGDFGVPINIGTLLAPIDMNKSEVNRIAKEIKCSQADTDDVSTAFELFKQHGFTTTNTTSCVIGGNL